MNRRNPMADGEISFGRFRRELRRGNEPVQLGGRALDILCFLASVSVSYRAAI